MNLTIELSDEKAAALKAQAEAQDSQLSAGCSSSPSNTPSQFQLLTGRR